MLCTMPLASAHPTVLHVERDAEILADDHAVRVTTSTRQPRSASSSATDSGVVEADLVDQHDVAGGRRRR